MFNDLAVTHAHDVDSLELNFSAGRWHAQEFPLVGSVIGLIRRHAVAIRDLPMDVGVKSGRQRVASDTVLAPALSGVRPGCGV